MSSSRRGWSRFARARLSSWRAAGLALGVSLAAAAVVGLGSLELVPMPALSAAPAPPKATGSVSIEAPARLRPERPKPVPRKSWRRSSGTSAESAPTLVSTTVRQEVTVEAPAPPKIAKTNFSQSEESAPEGRGERHDGAASDRQLTRTFTSEREAAEHATASQADEPAPSSARDESHQG